MKVLTGEEFRQLSDDQAAAFWGDANYPFDRSSYGWCLTFHTISNCNIATPITVQLKSLGYHFMTGSWLKAHYEELLALRKFYADHYPNNPVEEPIEEPTYANCT